MKLKQCECEDGKYRCEADEVPMSFYVLLVSTILIIIFAFMMGVIVTSNRPQPEYIYLHKCK